MNLFEAVNKSNNEFPIASNRIQCSNLRFRLFASEYGTYTKSIGFYCWIRLKMDWKAYLSRRLDFPWVSSNAG